MKNLLFDKYDLTPLPPMPPGRMPNRVVDVRRSNADFVYVGRSMGSRYRGHVLANPYRLEKNATPAERRSIILKYRDWLSTQLDTEVLGFPVDIGSGVIKATVYPNSQALVIQRAFNFLPGKTLGCWCGNWNGEGEPEFDCHAVELIRLLRERGLA